MIKRDNAYEKYLDEIFKKVLINSLIFTDDLKSFFDEADFETNDYNVLLDSLYEYLPLFKNENIFDDRLKDRFYELLEYVINMNINMNLIDKTNIMNDVKKILNNINGENNEDFLFRQIMIRDYGLFNCISNGIEVNHLLKIHRGNDKLKDIYYDSIVDDFLVMHLLLTTDAIFEDTYDACLLLNNFYRSINYFFYECRGLFKNKKCFERVNMIIKMNSELCQNGKNNIDPKFFELEKVTKKIVKKIEVKFKNFY